MQKCKNRFHIQHHIDPDTGERFSFLFDDNQGFPHFHATAFVSRQLRHRFTHNTQVGYLQAIKKILLWEEQANLSIELLFAKQEFLTSAQLDDLARFLRLKAQSKNGETITQKKFNSDLSYCSEYLTWLVHEVLVDSSTKNVDEYLFRQFNTFSVQKSRKTGSKSAYAQKILDAYLSDEARKRLESLFFSPFESLGNSGSSERFRNILMLRVLYETGMRAGELLSLKLKNFEESTGGEKAKLVIERNHHDIVDTRLRQPVAKTRGRTLAITKSLELMILDYLQDYRSQVAGANFTDNDFIFIVHQGGEQSGKPLSANTLQSAIASLKDKFKDLKELHPHLLRHDWNYRFSNIKNNSPSEEHQIRCYLMGWSLTSDMAKIYNERHTIERANEISAMMNERTDQKKLKFT